MYVNATPGNKGNIFTGLVRELFSSKDVPESSHSLNFCVQHREIVSTKLIWSFYVRSRMRHSHQASGHVQAELSTVWRVCRLCLGLVRKGGLFQRVVCFMRFRKLLQGKEFQQCLCSQWLERISPGELRLDGYFPVASVRQDSIKLWPCVAYCTNIHCFL